MSDAPGGRICIDCFEKAESSLGPVDPSEFDCNEWARQHSSKIASECGLCAKRTDILVPCCCCDDAVCDACCNKATLERFFATGVAETICNACIPPEAYSDSDGQTTSVIGDHSVEFCIVCQSYHMQNSSPDGINCDIDAHEPSPLLRLCIESLVRDTLAKKSPEPVAKQPAIAAEKAPAAATQASSSLAGLQTAKEIQRDNFLLSLQVEIKEMEGRLSKQIEKSLNLKICDIRKSLGISDTLEGSHLSRDQSSQTSAEDLQRAQILYKRYKVQEDPATALLETLPNLFERIAKSLEKCNLNQNGSSGKPPGPNHRENPPPTKEFEQLKAQKKP